MNNKVSKPEKNIPKNNEEAYDKEIEKNVIIHKMPRNVDEMKKMKKVERGFSTSGDDENGGGKKEDANVKIIGAVIIFCGLFILIGGTYIGFIYLVKPYLKSPDVAVIDDSDNKNTAEDRKSKDDKVEDKIDDEKDNKNDKDSKENENNEDKKDKEDETPIIDNDDDEENVISTSSESTTTPIQDDLPADDDDEVVIIDDDQDGLLNIEEELLGTNKDLADSDGDGYEDKTELLNLYDPASIRKLIENDNIGDYTNDKFGYKVFYPSKWETNLLDESKTVMFLAQDRTYISIIVQKNLEEKSVEDWYREQFKYKDLGVIESIEDNNWQGVKNIEGTIFYLSSADMKNIYTLSLTQNSDKSGEDYFNIIRMMVNSFEFTE